MVSSTQTKRYRKSGCMKLLNAVSLTHIKAEPYTSEEIDNHEYADRIWATIAQCKREAQDACEKAWSDGYWAGVHDREHSSLGGSRGSV